MDKYGVETPNKAPKCPICGADAVKDGDVYRCPNHGSKPFELKEVFYDSEADDVEPQETEVDE